MGRRGGDWRGAMAINAMYIKLWPEFLFVAL